MAAARLRALLEGAKAEREAAYKELAALASGDDADATTELAAASLHVGGLEGGLEDEAALAASFARFGAVLAATLHRRREGAKVSWSLLTFAEPAAARAALECAAELSAGGLVACGLDMQRVLGRTGPLGAVLERHKARVAVSIAKGVVPALVGVLCADASRVGAAEARRASLLLGGLLLLDRLAVGVELVRDGRNLQAWAAPRSALAALVAKAPAELTREDVTLAACDALPDCAKWAQGFTAICAELGLDQTARFMAWMESNPHTTARLPADDKNLRFLELALDACRAPEDLSGLERAGLWWLMFCIICQRPAVCAAALAAGVLEVMISTLRTSSPDDWLGWQTATGLQAGAIFTLLCQFTLSVRTAPSSLSRVRSCLTEPRGAQTPGADLIERFIDCGAVEACVAALRAFELRGAGRAGEANVMVVVHALITIQPLDLTAPEAAPVVRQLREAPSALRFTMAHPLRHVSALGHDSAPYCGMLCAVVFGKEEGGGFDFARGTIDDILKVMRDQLSGALAPFFAVLPAHWFRPVVHLAISDVNKRTLVKSARLIPLLLEALFLEPEHARKGAADSMKAPIQADAAGCLLQVAVFEAGRAMLQRDPAAVRALRVLADGGALTEEAKLSAEGALVAIEGVKGGGGGGVAAGKHIMVSCECAASSIETHPALTHSWCVAGADQWDVQATVERAVRSLQRRQYLVWLDLDRMKGSTVDAMSDAIDNAAVMLYAVSEPYKESGNCRLEANYAHQRGVDMIPLLVEKGYQPNGWLGLLMGTRLWYPFYHAEGDDEAAFERRLDAVVREIGDRGQPKPQPAAAASGGAAPPARTLAPPEASPFPAPAPAPAPVPAAPPRAALTTSDAGHGRAPAAQAMPQAAPPVAHGGSLAELSRFVKEQQVVLFEREAQADARAERARQDARAERAELEARMEAQRREMEARLEAERRELEVRLASARAITDEELAALQARLEALRGARLLSDAQAFALEDLCADVIELEAAAGALTMQAVHTSRAVAKARTLVAMSERVPADAAFARQLKRKFV
jgi:hypothetical protein